MVVSVYNTSKRSHFNRALLCRLLNSQRHLILSVSLSTIRVLFTLFSKFISSFLHGTCSLSASCPFHQLVRLLELIDSHILSIWAKCRTLYNRLVQNVEAKIGYRMKLLISLDILPGYSSVSFIVS